MDGRTSLLLGTVSLTMLLAGCVTTQPAKVADTKVIPPENAPVVKKADGPKRNPLPATEIAYGKMKESEADSALAKKQPQAQAALRDEARLAYQKALKLDPNNLEAQRCLARLYAKIGDFDRAQAIYRKALEKHGNDAGLWFDLGLCHNRRKDFAASERCFSKAVELDPENREYLKKLGFTLAWTGKVDQGLVHLTRAHQSAAQAHFSIACMFDQKEQREPAIQHLRLALRENADLQAARDLLDALENSGANRPRRGRLESPVALQ